jgi:hypothetical protein
MAQGIRCRKEFMKRKQLDRHTTQWKWRKLAPLTLQRGRKFRIVHPHDWYMYYRIVFLLGQYVKHVTCRTVWNACIEKALEFFLASLEIHSVLEQDSVILYVIAVCLSTALFNEYKFLFPLKKKKTSYCPAFNNLTLLSFPHHLNFINSQLFSVNFFTNTRSSNNLEYKMKKVEICDQLLSPERKMFKLYRKCELQNSTKKQIQRGG